MPNIVLRDRNGNPLNFHGAEYFDSVAPDGTETPYAAYDPETLTPGNLANGVKVGDVVGTMTVPNVVENLPIALDFSNGNQVITAPDGEAVKSAIIQKPATLTPENIADGVDIAGIVGKLVASGGASNVCMATYTAGYSFVATSSAVTLIPKEDLDKIGFDSATKKFAIMIATDSGVGMYGYYIPAIIAQTNYAISPAGSSVNAYGVQLRRYKTSSSASYTSVSSAYCTSDSISIGIDGWMRYNNYGLQYYGGSNNPLYATTYVIIAGVIS